MTFTTKKSDDVVDKIDSTPFKFLKMYVKSALTDNSKYFLKFAKYFFLKYEIRIDHL